MFIGYAPEHEALRQELREYYAKLLTPDVVAELAASEGVGPISREITKQMAADGWLGIGWPTEYGGQGRGHVDQFIFFDESMRAGAPVPMLRSTPSPRRSEYGSQAQKDLFLPKILRGRDPLLHRLLRARARAPTSRRSRRGRAATATSGVINGQKIFTSLATAADYVWLAVRTSRRRRSTGASRSSSCPPRRPGFKVIRSLLRQLQHELHLLRGRPRPGRQPRRRGERGWSLIVEQLNHERVTLCSSGIIERALDDVRRYAQATEVSGGGRLIDEPWVQHNLAWVHARLDVLRMLNWRVAWRAERGEPLDPAAASSVKVFGTELYMEGLRRLLEVLGPVAGLRDGSPDAVLHGRIANSLRGLHVLTFGGGTNELQRDLIAIFGLGLPGSPR